MGQREVLDELLVRRRFFERVELFALDVLDDRVLEHRGVVCDPNDRGNRLKADSARRAPAALAGDQLVRTVLSRTDQDRLEHANFADGLRK